MRLRDLTTQEIEEWRAARLEAGRAKYGDDHLDRYTVVDIVEEILDARNMLPFLLERMTRAGHRLSDRVAEEFKALGDALWSAQEAARWLDGHLPAEVCTDGKGGNRVWWSKKAAERQRTCAEDHRRRVGVSDR